MTEIFLPIKGYEGLYEVSNFGRVRTIKRQGTDTRILKGSIDHTGYHRISLAKDGVHKSHGVHRLVCSTFIDNPENKQTVNHKDGNKLNNHVDNLEWMTYSENHTHAYRELHRPSHMVGKTGVLHPGAKQVKKTCINTGITTYFTTLREAAKSGDFNEGHISACCHNNRKSHKGFYWSFY